MIKTEGVSVMEDEKQDRPNAFKDMARLIKEKKYKEFFNKYLPFRDILFIGVLIFILLAYNQSVAECRQIAEQPCNYCVPSYITEEKIVWTNYTETNTASLTINETATK